MWCRPPCSLARPFHNIICPKAKEIPLCYSTVLPNIPYCTNYFHLLFSKQNLKVDVYMNPNSENVTESSKGNQLLITLLMLLCNLLNIDDCCRHADIM